MNAASSRDADLPFGLGAPAFAIGHSGRVGASRLFLKFQVWGRCLDPDAVTRLSGVQPSRQFAVGEARGRYAHERAGWEWHSATASDTEGLLDALVGVLGHCATALGALVADVGAEVSLAVVGEIGGMVVATAEEADRRRLSWGEESSKAFEPFLDADRVGLYFNPAVVRFLAATGASIDTHIDFELDPLHPAWFESDDAD